MLSKITSVKSDEIKRACLKLACDSVQNEKNNQKVDREAFKYERFDPERSPPLNLE